MKKQTTKTHKTPLGTMWQQTQFGRPCPTEETLHLVQRPSARKLEQMKTLFSFKTIEKREGVFELRF